MLYKAAASSGQGFTTINGWHNRHRLFVPTRAADHLHLKTQLRHIYMYLPRIYLRNDRILPVSRHPRPQKASRHIRWLRYDRILASTTHRTAINPENHVTDQKIFYFSFVRSIRLLYFFMHRRPFSGLFLITNEGRSTTKTIPPIQIQISLQTVTTNGDQQRTPPMHRAVLACTILFCANGGRSATNTHPP